ncbi:universal stress protein [Pseudarthrobacter sp. NPDC058362]|uniref:universal stress protein n=1 Tax=Pseudarthrobacter sp. NPDC058362 TaxID=3346458 RepID=UPI00365D95E8
MAAEESASLPLLVGVVPGQHPEVLATAASLAARLGVPLSCAYVDEASYVVEWDPARSAHRLSPHPGADDADMAALTAGLKEAITAAAAGAGEPPAQWSLHTLTGDAARALGRQAAELGASMIIVGTSERGLAHRISEALNGSVGTWLSHHQDRPVLVVPPRPERDSSPEKRREK